MDLKTFSISRNERLGLACETSYLQLYTVSKAKVIEHISRN